MSALKWKIYYYSFYYAVKTFASKDAERIKETIKMECVCVQEQAHPRSFNLRKCSHCEQSFLLVSRISALIIMFCNSEDPKGKKWTLVCEVHIPAKTWTACL